MSTSEASSPQTTSPREIVEKYASNIAESMEENLRALSEMNEDNLQRLALALNKFYKSLFRKNTGIFSAEKINKELKKVPNLKPSLPSIPKNFYIKYKSAIGQGKGNPGRPRKLFVSKKQMQTRKRRGIVSDMSNVSLAMCLDENERPISLDQCLPNATNQGSNCFPQQFSQQNANSRQPDLLVAETLISNQCKR